MSTKKLIEEFENSLQEKRKKLGLDSVKLTKADLFLLRKYKRHIKDTLMDIANRDSLDDGFFWKDNEYNDARKRKLVKDQIYIDEKNLFEELRQHMKKDNIHEINQVLFKKALQEMTNSDDGFDDDFFFMDRHIHIEYVKFGKNDLIRVIFG